MRLALQIACSVAFLCVALHQVSAHEVVALLSGSGGPGTTRLASWLVVAILVGVLAALVNTVKWWLLLRAAGARLSWGRVLYHYLCGYFFNTIFTGAGEVKRVLDAGRESGNTAAVASSVFVERWTGVMGQLTLSLVALLVACRMHEGLVWLTVLNLAGCAGLAALFVALAVASRRAARDTAPLRGWRGGWQGALEAFGRVRGAPGVMASAVALSFVVPSLGVVCHACLAAALGTGFGFLWVVPIATVFGQLPVSLNGLGVQEVAYVALFERTGMAGAQAMALSMLGHLVRLAVGGLGGIALLTGAPLAGRAHIEEWTEDAPAPASSVEGEEVPSPTV